MHDVTEDGGDITSGDIVDGLLDDWESVGDVSNALWADIVVVKVVLVADAVSDGLLDEGNELGEIGDDLGEVAGLEVVEELWDEGNELVDVVQALSDVVSLEFWEGGGGAIGSDLLELGDELHNVRKDGSEVASGDIVDGLLDEWEGVGDVLDALWGDTVSSHDFLGLGAVGDGVLEEGDELGEIGHHFGKITRLDVIDQLWDEGDELVDVVQALCDVI